MVKGVTKGYEKKLEINGVGYKCEQKGETLVFALGYSHPIEFHAPQEREGQDREADADHPHQRRSPGGWPGGGADRSFRKPEPYKGKGVKYSDETIRRKSAKPA